MIHRFKKVQQVLVLVLFLNLAVAFAKIIYGTLTGTLSMTADGYHSLFDGVSNIVGLVGIFIASRPPDREHPYGHQKYETVASIFIAVLLLFVGFEIFQNALDRFLVRSTPGVTALSFIIMLGTMGVNYLVTRYEHGQGVALRSSVLIADSMHTKSDIYVSFSVIVSLVAIRSGFPLLDPIIALLISFLIFRAGFRIMKESSKVLLDMSRLEEEEICNLVLGIEGVLGCHKIRTRGGMGDIRIDMHVLVRSDLPLEDAHFIAHRVSKMLKVEYKDVTDVVVHLEPALPQESNSKKTS
ncbi:cation transporter [Methanosarcina sp. 2.H.T.1A.6]|uniref:cation diffusion facilitator family transporter n=1 Tax=unclassified Methanosarcina TaxID=2644672 RepID=UPI00062210AE|nr:MULTISPECIES: cation diffusion facilitator family transporter [unclassified Methanosarcina]KKG14831.1 cation transporter [Methanosarcina sp. 2.H.T.1A.3]KKG22449.1 cation transporter [Methanosarcina sp. 2.H.T.1A.15]KKG23963.1 cation transporter [Methanosarcina sp. 2.H.T.1A.6]KKG26399.1 cation transporter [Methanosarcina sp. 2.H.T.1A.8]